jgi:hypothetical protein
MNTYNLSCKETLLQLLLEEQKEVLSFLKNCSSDDMVAVRLEDNEEGQPRLYGCYCLSSDEYRNYQQSGGIWNHVSVSKLKKKLEI